MLVANVEIRTRPGQARTVARRMADTKGIESLATDGDRRVVATWKVPDGETLEGLSEVLQAMNPEILEVSPTPLGEED